MVSEEKWDYQLQKDFQRYAETQRAHIAKFLEKNKPQFLTLHQAVKLISDSIEKQISLKGTLWAIIDPNIVQVLSYEPVRQVKRILRATPYDKEFLTDYWLEKYEIELEESYGSWEFKVGLQFISQWYDYGFGDSYPVSRIYDYPSCIISTFLFVRAK